jgi:hypothetical protein
MKAPDGRMMQHLMTLFGDTGDEEVKQGNHAVVDTGNAETLVLDIELASIDDCDLYVDTSLTRSFDSWTAAYTRTAAAGVGSLRVYLEAKDGATNPLERFVRWRVKSASSPTGDWSICLSIACQVKGLVN